eukprot:scaffold8672_cov50-Attheya_sp.AAC.2
MTVCGSAKFVSQNGWLDSLVQKISENTRKEDLPDGTWRVPLTSLARCSRGGKTRALYELAHKLREDMSIATLFVSFNDFSDCQSEIDRGDSSLDMLCRRIAFAARPLENRCESAQDDFKKFINFCVSPDEVKAWIGKESIVLLIDELNRVVMDEAVAQFLKMEFCVSKGRYYVFSSHTSATNPEMSLPLQSFRAMDIADLPLIHNLSNAKEKLNISELTPRLALYYGLVPALLVTSLTIEGLADMGQIDQRVTKACINLNLNFTLLQTVIHSFFTGDAMRSELDVLLDASHTKNYWIPCYLMTVLKKLGTAMQDRFGLGLRNVASDTECWSTCKEGSGDGWESLFVLVLWLRFAAGKTDDVDCIPSVVTQPEHVSRTLLYNYPFPMMSSIAKVKNVNELDAALDEILNGYEWDGGFPKVSIYYPKLANFAEYDVFVCVWKQDDGVVTKELYGYQLKEGKEIPGQIATLPHSYLVRGNPALQYSEMRGWKLLATPGLREFFGVSGARWLPEEWQGLSGK